MNFLHLAGRTVNQGLYLTLALLAALLLSGCGLDAGFNPAIEDRQTSATFRTETELVPNSRLVRQNTMPRWQAGRFAFVRGSDQLLVFTHITSLADWDDKKDQFINRKDHAMERLWVQIPEGTRLGDVLDAERMEAKYLIGYDAGLIGDGQFIKPWKTTGSLVLLEDHPDRLIIHANLLIAPKRRPNWSMQGVFEVQKNAQGIYAQPLPPDIREAFLGTSVVSQAINDSASASPIPPGQLMPAMPRNGNTPAAATAESTEATPVAPAAGSPDASVAPDVASPSTDSPATPTAPSTTPGTATDPQVAATEAQTDATEQAATDTTQAAAEPQPSVVGPWINQIPKWYERYQFNDNGTFVHANCRPGYPPAINTGTWEIRNNQFLVLTIKTYTFGHIGKWSPDSAYLKKPDVGVLRMTWKDDGALHLEGTVWRRGREPLNLTFTRGNYPDMAIIPPPSEW